MQNPLKPLKHLVQMLGQTAEVEYTCEDAHRLLDEYVECVLRGEDVSKLMPLVHKHLQMCPDCREEYEALLRIMQANPPPRPVQRPQ